MTTITDAIARELGADRLVTDEAALAAYRTDYWILAHLRRRQGRLGDPRSPWCSPATRRRWPPW